MIKIEVEDKRFLTVFFKQEGGIIKKKVKVITSKTYKGVLEKLREEEKIPTDLVKETFGQDQKEGIKSIRNMEEFEDDTN